MYVYKYVYIYMYIYTYYICIHIHTYILHICMYMYICGIICNMTGLLSSLPDDYVTVTLKFALIHVCAMTHLYVCHDLFE